MRQSLTAGRACVESPGRAIPARAGSFHALSTWRCAPPAHSQAIDRVHVWLLPFFKTFAARHSAIPCRFRVVGAAGCASKDRGRVAARRFARINHVEQWPHPTRTSGFSLMVLVVWTGRMRDLGSNTFHLTG